MHYFKHSRNELLQDFGLVGNNFICHLFHQRQNTLHPIAKTRGYLVILVLFLQKLPSSVTSPSDIPVASTNLKRNASDTKDSLRNRVQLTGVNFLLDLYGCGTTDLCEDSAIFNRFVHCPFC